MQVKAKFKCLLYTDIISEYDKSRQVHFDAVSTKDGDSADYSKYTPSGELKMRISEETSAYDFFVPGKDYYLTFEQAEN